MTIRSRSRGFTLIELLVSLSIISLLLSVVLSSVNSARDRARIAAGRRFEASLQHALGSDIIVEYSFETSDLKLDTSGNNYNGTWIASPAVSTSGLKGKAADFSFGGGFVAPGLDLSQYGSFTVSAFIYPRSYAGASDGSGCSHWVYDSNYFGIACNNNLWVNLNSATRVYFYPPDLKLNTWNHVVISYTGGAATYYIDGKYIGTANIGGLSSGTTNLYIGGPGAGWYSNGIIDEVRVYGKAIGQ